MNKRSILTCLIVVISTLLICTAVSFADDIDDAIVAATTKYLSKEAPDTEISVVVEKVIPGFARATAIPVGGVITDPVDVYLKGSGQKWKVLTFGTGLIDSDLTEFGIPTSLAD